MRRQTREGTARFPAAFPGRHARFVKPERVAEIAFAEFTAQGVVRQASFMGLREDKEAEAVTRESPQHIFTPKESYQAVKLTHPEREFWPGISKARMAAYYEAVAPAMLPFIARRPLSLVCCPDGEKGECFYQKHHTGCLHTALKRVSIREREKTREYVYVENAAGLVALAQMGVLEIHPWGAFTRDVEKPERLSLDLDPDPEVPFARVREAALALRLLAEAAGLSRAMAAMLRKLAPE